MFELRIVNDSVQLDLGFILLIVGYESNVLTSTVFTFSLYWNQ